MRRVSGSVSYTGAITNPGTADWSVTKTGTGTYTIRLFRPFRGVFVITGSPAGLGIISFGASSDGAFFNVYTYNPSTGSSTDNSFNFEAFGR